MQLVGISEIAELAGVSRQAVSNWRTRFKDFPHPLAELSSGPVWQNEDIELWLRTREGTATKVTNSIRHETIDIGKLSRQEKAMNTWWLATSKDYTSYLELKYRKVVAQGWSELGDLRTLCPLASDPGNRNLFQQVVQTLEGIRYQSNVPKSPVVMWNLLRIQAGDLIVGIEGTMVKGICQMPINGWESYRYDSTGVYEYAQTVGFPVEWVDWDPAVFGFTPTPPAKGVLGVTGLINKHQAIVSAWDVYQLSKQPGSTPGGATFTNC